MITKASARGILLSLLGYLALFFTITLLHYYIEQAQ